MEYREAEVFKDESAYNHETYLDMINECLDDIKAMVAIQADAARNVNRLFHNLAILRKRAIETANEY
jgi:hypothetical protein